LLRQFILCFCAAFTLALPVSAQTTPESGSAQEGALLTVTLVTGETVSLDRKTLDSLPQETFRTSTTWTEGIIEFSGPALKDVLEFAGVEEDRSIAARAINDYQVVFAPHHIEDRVPIIATKLDGAPFSRRDRGPLWIVFPYDSSDNYRTEEVISLSIWQLVDLTVRP
jgi:hypothetical protein